MKSLTYAILVLVSLEWLLHSCANPVAPSGGPKDTIPPTLLESQPAHQSTRVKGKTFTLTFDETVDAAKLKANLIITPVGKYTYKHFIRKNTLTLEFDQPFADSTTYTLNFFDGVTDITEKNPVVNLIIAFSTGDYIDSMTVNGKVIDLFTDKPMKKVTVGLYILTDTLNFLKHKPNYFSTTNAYGQFTLSNLKNTQYKILAFQDDNKNLLLEPAKEAHAFLADTLQFNDTTSLDSLKLPLLLNNVAPLTLISGRPFGAYFEIKYNKPIASYYIHSDTMQRYTLSSQLLTDKENIRIYNPGISESDSIPVILTTSDSVKNTKTDTLYAKFRPSSRKTEEFNASPVPPKLAPYLKSDSLILIFTKPVKPIDSLQTALQYDTLVSLNQTLIPITWNHNHTRLSFAPITHDLKQLTDTLQQLLNTNKPDSLSTDTAQIILYKQLTRLKPAAPTLHISPSQFISVENDTLNSISIPVTFPLPEDFGQLTAKINTTHTSYTLQLLNKGKVAYQLTNCTTCQFNYVQPGDYNVRILIDDNADGEWFQGNLIQQIPPETIIHLPETTTLRANWTVEFDFTF